MRAWGQGNKQYDNLHSLLYLKYICIRAKTTLIAQRFQLIEMYGWPFGNLYIESTTLLSCAQMTWYHELQ